MAAECKRTVYVLPSTKFTEGANGTFTFAPVALDRVKIAQYAVARAESKFGWKRAAFARQLFGEGDTRQRVNGWLKRGLPADQDAIVAKKLGLTIEELHSAGEQDPPEPALPEEAVIFAREWLRLTPRARTHIRGLVLEMLEAREIDGSRGLSDADRPELHQPRSATPAL